MNSDDEKYMRLALREAARAAERREVPVGAVVIAAGKVIGRGANRPIRANDPTAHAEIVALRKACAKAGNYRLPGATIYVTIEPCAMCLGAIVQARVKRLVYGALDPKSGAVISIMTFPFDRTNHLLETSGGVLANECSRVLRVFFQARRGK
jgi:tRNA(adenine34) deaminase